ncbi:MAG: DUF1049 domain-containing protein [Peptostreptococcaceae bacterium]|nr:DUF1049 domain-containing protein [Peptostreptococcaceae bacterium]
MQKNQFLFIISLIFSGVIAFFALINGSTVSVDLFFYKLEASLALVVLASAILGAIIVTLLGLAQYIKMKMVIKKMSKENQELNIKNQELTKQVKDVTDAEATRNAEYVKKAKDLEEEKAASEAEAARNAEYVNQANDLNNVKNT